MRAVVFAGNNVLEVKEIERPVPKAGEVLLRVHNCGVCGSDLHMVQHGFLPPGSVMGHEFSGEVAELGEGVSDWKVGERAISLPLMSCGECSSCKSGAVLQCAKFESLGLGNLPGGFCEYVRVKPSSMLKIPDHVSYREAALTEPMAVGLHAINKANLKALQGCLIMGAGTVGLGVLLWALDRKASIVVSEPSEGRRNLVSKLGNVFAVDPKVTSPLDTLLSMAPLGAEVVIECVGVPGTLQQAMDYAARNGTVVVMGVCMTSDSIRPLTGVMKELELKFGLGYTFDEFKEAFEAIATKRIDVTPLITDIVTIDDFPGVFNSLMRPNNKGKVLLEF